MKGSLFQHIISHAVVVIDFCCTIRYQLRFFPVSFEVDFIIFIPGVLLCAIGSTTLQQKTLGTLHISATRGTS